jgi:ABC-type transporter Mla subunit MlaD
LQVDINDEAKQIVEELGAAINAAVEQSSEVSDAIGRLREAGYELELTLRLEIGLRQLDQQDGEANEDVTLDLTDDDMRTLRRMKIRIDEAE